VTLIVQKWWLKIVPPVVATLVISGYTIYYTPGLAVEIIIRMGVQLFNIVIIICCENKLKWRMIWTNLHREKWIQVNNFILNNIPENIMILDVKGDIKFISDSCKAFMEKLKSSPDTPPQEFFENIRDLHQQFEPETPSRSLFESTLHVERLASSTRFFGSNPVPLQPKYEPKVAALFDLITNFKTIIKDKNLQERQFLIYNGKLRSETHQQEKSIEVKISFAQHYKNEYIILILRDTTQRDLLVTLEETNKYKDQLLASVSHELRAPLNGNINLVETAVNSKEIPETLKESLLIPALRSSKFLLHIINDMLDMSQIKEKKLRLVYQSADLKETLKNTAQLIELQANKKGINLTLDLHPNLPDNFLTDHLRVSQIVLNLLTNAIKFTKEGRVKLKAIPVTDQNWVKITVEDSGIGMSQENIQKLFKSYTRIEIEDRPKMNPTGVGLGLNIASNLADLLAPASCPGISATSIPNKGSVFSFILENKEKISSSTIPIRIHLDGSSDSSDVAEELARVSPARCSPLRLQKTNTSVSFTPFNNSVAYDSDTPINLASKCSCPKILIVDDNPFNTMAFETILNSLDLKCDSVFSGPSALKKLLSRQEKTCGKNCQQYQVVFMDQEMPEMTGAETVKEIKKLQSGKLFPEIRLIGCTAHKSKQEVDSFLEAGLEQCIHKPISKVMIHDILKAFL